MVEQGWISVHRKIRDSWIWSEKPYDKAHAWIDLLLSANYEDKKVSLGNQIVEVQRGSFITSELKLMDRWGWGKEKTRNFLKMLEADGMIKKISDKRKTLIKIENYNSYQISAENQTASNQDISTDTEDVQTPSRPQADHEPYTTNNINNLNKIIILSSDMTPYTQIMELFISLCPTLPKIKSIEDNRQKVVKARWKEHPEIEFFKGLFKKVNSSDFLSGRNDKWKNCCFDWIMKPTNIQKIIEGNYDNKQEHGQWEKIDS